MKVRIKSTQPEPEVIVELIQTGKGDVSLVSGGYYLATISEKGILVHSAIPRAFGFALDSEDRLVVVKD